jgi:hypothetical protein
MGLGASKGEKNGLPVTSLSEIMKKYGHTFIDVLKIDVEYSEVDVIPAIMGAFAEPPFEQLLLEVHHVRGAARRRAVPFFNPSNTTTPDSLPLPSSFPSPLSPRSGTTTARRCGASSRRSRRRTACPS